MKKNFTCCAKSSFRNFALLLLLLFSSRSIYAQSNRVYATGIVSSTFTTQPGNAVDGNLATSATVSASSGIAINIGAYSGYVELSYPGPLPANTTSYVKIQTQDNLLPSLLGGSLGTVVSNVLGAVLIGNQEFTVQAKNGNEVVLQGDSQDAGDFATERMRIVTDAQGNFYVAITPAQEYNRIRVRNRLGSILGLFNTRTLQVFESFYVTGFDNCGIPSHTAFSGDGLNLDLLNLGNVGVTNPGNAIDGNPDSFSQLSLGVLAVGASVEQTVYYNRLSQASEEFSVRLKVDPSLLALGLGNNIQLIASNGTTVVDSRTLSSLLNLDLLTLLQGNQTANIPFAPILPADRITVRYSSLLNVQLTQSLDLFEIVRVPKPPTVTNPIALNVTICSGTTASLTATTVATNEIRWYSEATGGVPLATLPSGTPYVTNSLNASTSYYAAVIRTGCPEESRRIKVDVQVLNTPTAADITIPSTLTACQGNITLNPVSAIGGATIKYYTDQNKTQEITTGYAGNPGVNYVKNPTTGVLAITGLNAANSPYRYYVSLTVNGLCENVANTLKEVVVNFSSQLSVQVSSPFSACGVVNLRDAILNFDASNTYNFFNASSAPISAEAASNITVSGTYFIQAQNASSACSSGLVPVTVNVNPIPTLVVTNAALVTQVGNTVTLGATSAAPIVWYAANGTALASNVAGPFTTAGTYSFTAIASLGSCTASGSVVVTVINPGDCPPLTQRNFANTQRWGSNITGGVTNPGNAIDGNLQTYSTITTGLGLLGIGTTWQILEWNQTIPAGTPVTIKLGSEYSGVTLAGGYSVVGTKRNGSGTPIDIGPLQSVSGSLLNLLPGQNNFDYTFVPSSATGPQAYDGVRIVVSSLVSVAQSAKVYEAHYDVPATQIACTNDAEDVLFGAVDLGVGVATALVGVDNAQNAIDNSITSFATMASGAGVLAAAEMTIAFRTPSVVGDAVKIRISRPGTLLTANVLSGLSIQPILNNALSGPSYENTSTLLSLQVLGSGEEAVLTLVPTQSFDKIRIRFGGVVNVLDILRIHDVKRVANTKVDGADDNNEITACQGQTITLQAGTAACTSFIWYDAAVGGNVVATGNSYTIPANLAAGTYTYYIQPVRFGCQSLERGKVTVNVRVTAPPSTILAVQINGGNDATICAPTGNVALNAVLNTTVTVTNPIYYWYSFDGTTQQLIPSQTGPTLQLSGLTSGTYTYFLGVGSDEFCPTAIGNRAQITFTIYPPSNATDIQASNVTACLGSTATLSPSSLLANPVFSYYLTNNTTQPIANGAVINGATYTINPNGSLSISGLIQAGSPYTYYVAVESDATCLNTAGNLLAVTVTVGNPNPPTTENTTQNFCQSTNPTIADLQVNQTGVLFYDAPLAGNLLPPTTPLTAGIYYAAQVDGTCESDIRLAITVTIGNPDTPTTNNLTQNFCQIANPTVANIQVNQTGVVFYDAPLAGNLIAPTTPLTPGIYYASIQQGTCESDIRLAITVTISDPNAPTTDNATQTFCRANNPTIADLDVNESNLVFYNSPTDGTPLALTDALQNGIYYVSVIDATGCESIDRLAITVVVTVVGPPTANETTQTFCKSDNPTIADLAVNETSVVFYDALVGGNMLAPTFALVEGVYFASIQNGLCESETRLGITVVINDPGTPSTLSATQNFCQVNNPTIGSIQVDQAGVLFYDAPTGGNLLASTTALVPGVYYASLQDGLCESAVRLEITVTIGNPNAPTTLDDTQNFCLSTSPTVANIQVNEANVVFYSQPTGGTAFLPTDLLTNGIYYAALVDGNGCESSIRLAITVTTTAVGVPTTNNLSQNFCQANNATVSNIQVNESGVVFFDAPVGGNLLVPTTPLTNGTYYATIQNGLCESDVRLAILVTIVDSSTPTTLDATQDFCKASNPTVASLQVNETGVIFYTVPSGGTALAPNTPLTDGIYYATIQTGNCESLSRLAITVTIIDLGTPSTSALTQTFCQETNPTISSLQVNETNLVFYNVATGGTPLATSTPLTAGIYYVALTDGTCESSIRLAITVAFFPTGNVTITGGGNQACFSEEVTYSTVAGMTNYIWDVISGSVTAGGQPTDNFVTVLWNMVGTGTVSVAFTNTTGCAGNNFATRDVTLTVCSDITIAKTVNNPTPMIDDNIVFTITVVNNGMSQFTDIGVSEQLPSGYQYVSSNTTLGTFSNVTGIWLIPLLNPGQTAILNVTVKVLPTGSYVNTATVEMSTPVDSDTSNNFSIMSAEPLCLTVYNEFSPNNDGDNDLFRIDCIENYPNNTLTVYNRYGVEVYRTRAYQNTWDGTANVNSPINQDNKLPTGTYYYTLDLGDGSRAKTGWIYLVR